jgi:hypothetical protein
MTGMASVNGPMAMGGMRFTKMPEKQARAISAFPLFGKRGASAAPTDPAIVAARGDC